MGQYYKIVNIKKKQYISPHTFGDGSKLMEFSMSANGVLAGLSILLADGNGRGGGDLNSDNPIVGSWAGGGGNSPSMAGGSGGGGAGSSGTGNAGAGNYGAGGGGGGNNIDGSAGGSGIVILKYPDTITITIGAGLSGSTGSPSGGFKVTTITSGTGNVSWA